MLEFLKPDRKDILDKRLLLVLAVYAVGLSLAIDQYGTKLILAYVRPEKATEELLGMGTYWLVFWTSVASYGLVRSLIQWFIGGWWYNVRIEWCVENMMIERDKHDKNLGRRIYIFNQLIYALPNVALFIVLSIACSNYFGWLELPVVVRVAAMLFLGACLLMTAINSHRMVVSNFEMDKKKAKVWFLIWPLVVLGMQALVMVYAILL